MNRAITNYRMKFSKVDAGLHGGGFAEAIIMRLEFDGEVREFLMSPESARIAANTLLGEMGGEHSPRLKQ